MIFLEVKTFASLHSVVLFSERYAQNTCQCFLGYKMGFLVCISNSYMN